VGDSQHHEAGRVRVTRLLLALVLLTSCTTLGGVVDRDARSVTWKCDGNAKVTLQTHAVVVTCPAGPAPTLTVQTPGQDLGRD